MTINANVALRRIEAIVTEIEELDRATNGAFRQYEDREARDLISHIERQRNSTRPRQD